MWEVTCNFCILHFSVPRAPCSWWKSQSQMFNIPNSSIILILLVLFHSMINITIIKISGDSWLTTGHPLSSIMYNSDLRWLPLSSRSLQIQYHTRGLLQVALPHVGESVKIMLIIELSPGLVWPGHGRPVNTPMICWPAHIHHRSGHQVSGGGVSRRGKQMTSYISSSSFHGDYLGTV